MRRGGGGGLSISCDCQSSCCLISYQALLGAKTYMDDRTRLSLNEHSHTLQLFIMLDTPSGLEYSGAKG